MEEILAVGDIIVGLNIGFSKVSLMMCEINSFNQPEIKAKASTDVKVFDFKGEIDKDIFLPAVIEILDEVEGKTNLHISSLYISIPGKVTKILQNSVQKETKEKLNAISSKEVVETILKATDISKEDTYTEIDIIPDRFALDNDLIVKDPTGKFSSKMTMYSQIILAKTEYLLNLQSMLREIDLNIDRLCAKNISIKKCCFRRDRYI